MDTMMKKLKPTAAFPMALLVSLFAVSIMDPVEADAKLLQFFDSQIQESALRGQVLKDSFRWLPAKLGAAVARAIRLQEGDEAWASYLAVYRDVVGAAYSRKSQNLPDLGSIPDLAPKIFQLWQAENYLRWIFLRDTAIGLLLIGKLLVILVWLAISLWEKYRTENTPVPSSSQFRVLPDQPLAFRALMAEPKGIGLYLQAEELGFLSPLTEKIVACFAASPDHPASLQDHLNIPGGLMMHTTRTIEAMAKLVQARPDDERKLFLLMALCHDIGKLFSYGRLEKQWIDRRLPHDRLSALMVASIPEFYTELSRTHREALLLALRYYHNPEELPTMAPPLSYTLLEVMHKADAIAYEEEKELGQKQVEAVKPYLWEALCLALLQLNINRYQGGYPEGFTSGEIVFVLEHALRERTLDQLPQELQEKLPIRRPSGRLHPAWPFLVEVLKEKDVLEIEVQGRKANPSALFNITATGTVYKCVVALSLEVLETVAPDAVMKWKQCQPYEIKIAGGRHGG